jgi:2-polyprenyl-6-methoxyphenol hydroxylase-like FAD-dependent oxidoreductase
LALLADWQGTVWAVTRAIIAGGGIVGLTTGRALLRAGVEVLVTEQAGAIRAAGATLGLWGNAVSVFDDLDVDVRSVGREAEMYFHGTSGQLLTVPEFGEEDHRYLLVHRASLNDLLAESVGYGNIRLEAAVAGFEEHEASVTVRFSDGSTERADLLIAADGLYSKVRAQLFPGTEAQEHAGHRAWRAIVKAEHIDVPDDRLIVGGKHRTRGGYVRARDGTVFWLLSQFGAPAPAASVKEECLVRSSWLTDGTWDCKLTELVDATPEEDILRNQVMVVPPLDRWVSRRVALIGDSAHAMSPHITAGASLGVEDVSVLRDNLSSNADLTTALKQYEAGRLPRYRQSAVLSRAVEVTETPEDFARNYAAFSHWLLTGR